MGCVHASMHVSEVEAADLWQGMRPWPFREDVPPQPAQKVAEECRADAGAGDEIATLTAIGAEHRGPDKTGDSHGTLRNT